MSENIKEDPSKPAWAISLGFYPGVLFGIRTYREKDLDTHVIYLPFIDIAIEIWS